jgi:nucleoside 2-deoxyribosyltransferase
MSKGWVYLAAPWIDKGVMEERAGLFEKAGYSITHKWWNYDGDELEEKDEFLETCARQDWQGVLDADAVVVFNTSKSEGKAVEQGIALASHIPIIVIGKRGEVSKNVFHYLDSCYWWVPTVEAAIESMQEVTGGQLRGV